MKTLWTEQYRPKTANEYVFKDQPQSRQERERTTLTGGILNAIRDEPPTTYRVQLTNYRTQLTNYGCNRESCRDKKKG